MKDNSKNKSNIINNFDLNENYIDYQEYYLLNHNLIYKITIFLNNNEIIIKCKNYIITLNINNIQDLTGIAFNTLIESYEFLTNKFEDNKVEFNNIILNKNIKLTIYNETNTNNNIIINLKYDVNQKDYFLSKINKLNVELNNLKIEINNLKKENDKYKKDINLIKNSKTKYNNTNFNLYSNITNDSFADIDLDKTFTIFKSIDNLFYLIYSLRKETIISYNLDNQQKITEIKSGHKKSITNFRHYLDKINKRDLIISISARDNNLKLWELKYWRCLLNINNVNKVGYLDSAYILNDNNNNYIITSNSNKNGESEKIKIYDFKGKKIKEINSSNQKTYFIDLYYDDLDINYYIYIIAGCENCIKVFNYNKNELYRKYYESNNGGHVCVIVYKKDKVLNLIESCDDGNIRIWNFHSGNLLKKFKISSQYLFGMCLWNDNYLYVACEDKTIKLIDINNGFIINNLYGHSNDVLSVDKITLPKYGECLISQGRRNDQIKMWIKENQY